AGQRLDFAQVADVVNLVDKFALSAAGNDGYWLCVDQPVQCTVHETQVMHLLRQHQALRRYSVALSVGKPSLAVGQQSEHRTDNRILQLKHTTAVRPALPGDAKTVLNSNSKSLTDCCSSTEIELSMCTSFSQLVRGKSVAKAVVDVAVLTATVAAVLPAAVAAVLPAAVAAVLPAAVAAVLPAAVAACCQCRRRRAAVAVAAVLPAAVAAVLPAAVAAVLPAVAAVLPVAVAPGEKMPTMSPSLMLTVWSSTLMTARPMPLSTSLATQRPTRSPCDLVPVTTPGHSDRVHEADFAGLTGIIQRSPGCSCTEAADTSLQAVESDATGLEMDRDVVFTEEVTAQDDGRRVKLLEYDDETMMDLYGSQSHCQSSLAQHRLLPSTPLMMMLLGCSRRLAFLHMSSLMQDTSAPVSIRQWRRRLRMRAVTKRTWPGWQLLRRGVEAECVSAERAGAGLLAVEAPSGTFRSSPLVDAAAEHGTRGEVTLHSWPRRDETGGVQRGPHSGHQVLAEEPVLDCSLAALRIRELEDRRTAAFAEACPDAWSMSSRNGSLATRKGFVASLTVVIDTKGLDAFVDSVETEAASSPALRRRPTRRPHLVREANSTLRLAREFLRTGNLAKAKRLLEHARQLNPYDAEAMAAYGEVFEHHRPPDYVKAEHYYGKALLTDPTNEKVQPHRPEKVYQYYHIPETHPGLRRLKKEHYFRYVYHSNGHRGQHAGPGADPRAILETRIAVGGKSLLEHNEVLGLDAALSFLAMWTCRRLGRLRNTQVFIADFEPPPANLVPSLMADFLNWLNSEDTAELHPVEVAALAHWKLVYIHPFYDGNGRTARSVTGMRADIFNVNSFPKWHPEF
uniref:protein adenylyltransferase n=1 Tax=Macrostomum lignano TaxID=282301 RepID=A0A1I8F285_9PLAT